MSNVAVIGMGYGDEGKGVVTQYLCSRFPNSIVVRFSGGHQCGHTVHNGELSHMFSNFGSGTLLGRPTYWSEYCTFEPVGFWTEYTILKNKGINPVIYINPHCPVTTPYDMHANRCSEEMEHGTCGVGFWKTLVRYNDVGVRLSFLDLFRSGLDEKLKNIGLYYAYLGDDICMEYYRECIENIKKLLGDCVFIISDVPNSFENRIFEGSQGILLDQKLGVFPHVTPSNTTPKNIIDMGYYIDEIFMVTRSYLTRHGNGPIQSTELLEDVCSSNIEANEENEYQGVFRRATLSTSLLEYAFRKGIAPYCYDYTTVNLVVTCIDQLSSFPLLKGNNSLDRYNKDDFLKCLYGLFPMDSIYTNDSCQSDTVRKYV